MGYTTITHKTGQYQNFWPDDTDYKIYLEDSSLTLLDLLYKAQEKWPGIDVGNIRIEPEHIHTDCLGYDRYDAGDYTNFIVITKVK